MDPSTVDCQVICDLLVVYASGEASAATAALIEAHLARCPECKEALEEIQMAEAALSDLEPVRRPNIDGRKILIFFQRLFFLVLVLLLFLLAAAVALVERWVIEGLLSIPLPQLYVPGSSAIWLVAGGLSLTAYAVIMAWRLRGEPEPRKQDPLLALFSAGLILLTCISAFKFLVSFDFPGAILGGAFLFLFYVFILWWRSAQRTGSPRREIFLSLKAAIPLIVLALAAFTLVGSGDFLMMLIGSGWFVLALVVTFVRLPELPYMTWMSVLALLIANAVLISNLAGGIAGLFDLRPEFPASLGHPQAGVTTGDAVRIDLGSFGFSGPESGALTAVHELPLPEGARAIRSQYRRPGGMPAWVTVIEFSSRQQAHSFFRSWKRQVANEFYAISLDLSSADFDQPDAHADHPLNWDLELPGVWFGQEGQLARGYDDTSLRAYSAWQVENYVTIVEVEGGVVQVLPLSRQIKEAIAESYRR